MRIEGEHEEEEILLGCGGGGSSSLLLRQRVGLDKVGFLEWMLYKLFIEQK